MPSDLRHTHPMHSQALRRVCSPSQCNKAGVVKGVTTAAVDCHVGEGEEVSISECQLCATALYTFAHRMRLPCHVALLSYNVSLAFFLFYVIEITYVELLNILNLKSCPDKHVLADF